MKNFQGKKSWGDKPNWNDKPKVMHKATCSECGRPCQVPFLPVNGKPVYCADCFADKYPGSPAPRTESRERMPFNKPSFNKFDSRPQFTKPAPASNDKQLSEINMKLDRLISVMEKMSFSSAVSNATPKSEAKSESSKVEADKPEKIVKKAKPTTPKAVKKAAPKKKVVAKKKK